MLKKNVHVTYIFFRLIILMYKITKCLFIFVNFKLYYNKL